ncbi:MAG: hypothetical protein A3K59_07050 [Euryarchaeota archaeon RBG_19FT_COMBO_69_17]|nr:MAG: hypothetical protein A3K59_07050 [Euryarchaeota archaeon RBG_19FT_COMBO_69_17]
MRCRATLTLRFRTAREADAIASSVRPDDDGYVRTRRNGSTITATAAADGPLSLLHTLDDYLACVSVAERTSEAVRPPARGRRPRA